MAFVLVVGLTSIYMGLVNCFKIDNALAFSGLIVGTFTCIIAYMELKEVNKPIIRQQPIVRQPQHIMIKKIIKYLLILGGFALLLFLVTMTFNQTVTILKDLLRVS